MPNPQGTSPFFKADQQPAWPVVEGKPSFDDSEENKKLFGIELAKDHINSFEAATAIFKETNIALWVSIKWLSDPVVIASRDLYLQTLKLTEPLLDKEQFAAKILAFAEEEILYNNGRTGFLHEAADRLKAYELYAKIAGFVGKVEVDNSTKTFTHNAIAIKLVKPDGQMEDMKTINSEVDQPDDGEIHPLPVKIKLVASR